MSDVQTMASEAAVTSADRQAAVQSFIMHHVTDSHEWTLLPGVHVSLPSFLTLHGLMVILSAAVLVLTLALTCRRMPTVPSRFLLLVELFVQYIRDGIAIPFLGENDGRKMTPLFCSFFTFILCMNLIGLAPCFASATGNLNVTGALAVVTFGFIVFGSIYRNGVIGFCKSFVPSGVPVPFLFLLVPIEVVSVFIKAFALMIRLFANMLAGHMVIFSLLGLVVIFGYYALPAVGVALGVYVLEVFVGVLQAYIFTLLSALFIGQSMHPAH